NLPVEHFYDDVLSFWSQTRTNYTPTLVVTYGGLAGDPYWRQHTDVWRHPLLSKHAPPALLAARNARRTSAPEEDFVDAASAREGLIGGGARGAGPPAPARASAKTRTEGPGGSKLIQGAQSCSQEGARPTRALQGSAQDWKAGRRGSRRG